MGLFSFLHKQKTADTQGPDYLYSEQELQEYEAYVEAHLGSYDQVFHEIASPDIHLDVILIPPASEHPYYTLVTMGAGAFRMNIPDSLQGYDLDYAEYVMLLPATWNLSSVEESDYWPMRALKNTARLPIYTDSWLGYGHTVQAKEDGSPYAENTGFNSLMLANAVGLDGSSLSLTLSSGRKLNFFLLIPIYPEELQFKMQNDADALLDLLLELPGFPVLDLQRKNTALPDA